MGPQVQPDLVPLRWATRRDVDQWTVEDRYPPRLAWVVRTSVLIYIETETPLKSDRPIVGLLCPTEKSRNLQVVEGVVDQGLAGFVGIALSPKCLAKSKRELDFDAVHGPRRLVLHVVPHVRVWIEMDLSIASPVSFKTTAWNPNSASSSWCT